MNDLKRYLKTTHFLQYLIDLIWQKTLIVMRTK